MNSNELECNQVVPRVQVHGSETGKHGPNNLVGSHTLHISYELIANVARGMIIR